MDIYGHKKLESFHSGKRLKSARKLMSLRAKDIAQTLNVAEATVYKWEDNRGLPKDRIPAASNIFKVEEWVFSDDHAISEEKLKRLIYKPTAISKLKEVDSDEFDAREELEKAINNYHQKIQKDVTFKLLEKFYIPLEITESPELAGSIIGESFDLDGDWSGYEDLLNDDDEEIISHQPRYFNNIEDLVAQESQFVLLGEAGSGKTKCLQWLLSNNIKKYKSGNQDHHLYLLDKIPTGRGPDHLNRL